MDGSPPTCLVCTGTPSVVAAVAHPTLRRLIVELLERDRTCWQLRAVADQPDLAAALTAQEPDLLVLDTGDFARFCRDSPPSFCRRRIIVIGPEPDPAYERAAHRGGAAAWLFRDRVGEELCACMRAVLGCTHRFAPTPPADCSAPRPNPLEN